MEVDAAHLFPDAGGHWGEFQGGDAAAGGDDAGHFGDGGGDIGHIAQAEAGGGADEGAVGEGQLEGIAGGQVHRSGGAAAGIAGGTLGGGEVQHFGQQVNAHHRRYAGAAGQGEGQVAGAGGDVQGGAGAAGGGEARRLPLPAVMQPAGHQRVHQVVAGGDAGEQVGHIAAFVRAAQVRHRGA